MNEGTAVSFQNATPTAEGFSMPAEWDPHEACLMAWPSREPLWEGRLSEAKRDYAAVARAVSDFEPVLMACNPGLAAEVRDLCGAAVEPLEIPLNDSWARDSGPIFVKDGSGTVAAVKFGFNAWGERWHPYDDDALLPQRVAAHLGVRLFEAPLVLEGGSIFVDGQGTLLTTEQCLLNPNRNPHLTREQIEELLREFLGVTTVVWLPFGYSLDVGPSGTDGHVDGVAQFVSPGHVVLEAPSNPESTEYSNGQMNLAALEAERDAAGRAFTISRLDIEPHPDASVAYANFYLANGAVIIPTDGTSGDAAAMDFLAGLYPDRQVVGVPGEVIAFGGGGPHCITQQIPASGVTPR